MKLFCALALLPLVSTGAGEREPHKPALVVVVCVDQLCYDYFDRFNANLSPTGLAAQARKEGVWFSNCRHQHAFTHTGPGHASLMTGTYAYRHGIIENDWYSRRLRLLRYCVTDPQARLIGAPTADAPVSPQRLMADTVGDELKLASGGKSKVFTLGIKDRAAILMAGRKADAAIWMSNEGHWITSSHYTRVLPQSIAELNASRTVWRYAGRSWTPLLDADSYQHGRTEDSFGERPLYAMTADFPHNMPPANHEYYIRNVACSPFGNEVTLEAARTLVRGEQLGLDDHPDILAINLTSNDYVGHAFGPDSLEVEDMVYRTDRELGQFAEFLRGHLGPRPFVMLVSGDHGVAPVPERRLAANLDAAREPLGIVDAITGNIAEMETGLEAYLARELGEPGSARHPFGYVDSFQEHEVFLNRSHPGLAGDRFNLACKLTRDWVLRHRSIVFAMSREDLAAEPPRGRQLQDMLRRSFHPVRSGDVLFVLKPFHIQSTAAASHGSPWLYDRHVPLIGIGTLHRESSNREVSPASIGPTIARLLQIEKPSQADAPALPELRFRASTSGPE